MTGVAVKPGARLRSGVDSTEVVVVKGVGTMDLRCGGAPVVPSADGGEPGGAPAPGLDGGTELGKRYVDGAGGIEVLCVRAGTGTLSMGDVPLELKSAKPLPASD